MKNYHSNFAENILNITQKLCIMKKRKIKYIILEKSKIKT